MPNGPVIRATLQDAEIAVWLARLDLDVDQVRQYAMLLSQDEQSRAERFRFEHDRRRFAVARGVLRVLLGDCLSAPPAAIVFGYTRHGKPFVATPAVNIHFNVSHSGERALYAISRTCPLGADIEYLNREVDHQGLARRFFTHSECTALERLPETIRKRAFLSCWTRKEAVVKAMGSGFSMPLDQFEVTVDPDDPPRVCDVTIALHDVAGWMLHTIDAGNDYVATVAAHRGK